MSGIGIYGTANAVQIENAKCKIENYGVRFAHGFESFPKAAPAGAFRSATGEAGS